MNKTGLAVVLATALAGCFPVLKTVQPSAQIVVTDVANVPIENARVVLATVRGPFGPRVLAEHLTDEDGKAAFQRVRKWEWNVLLPDGVGWYEWDLCVERLAYRALAVGEPEFRQQPLHLQLQTSASESKCQWPESPRQAPEVADR